MTRLPSNSLPLTHTHAAILSIGDELVLGQMLDTNSRAIAQRLMDAGVQTVEHVTIADDLDATVRTIERLCCSPTAAPLLVVTGGLGPTADDLTREALARVLGEQLVEDAEAFATLEQWLNSRGRPMTPAQRLQALRPASAQCLRNELGTAPGLFARITREGGGVISETGTGPGAGFGAPAPAPTACDAFFLPGPPNEWSPMFDRWVLPRLVLPEGHLVRTFLMQMIGLSEADAASRIPGLMNRDRNPLVGITASGGVLTWRIRFRGRASESDAQAAIQEVVDQLRGAMGQYILHDGEGLAGGRPLAATALDVLKERAQTVAVAESCTGGMLAEKLTDVPGSSSVFHAGWITYSNQAKVRDLGVQPATLEQHGAVSAETVREMAIGALQRARVTHAIAISGVAGPDGGSPPRSDKPVGTVWIALATRLGADNTMHTTCKRFRFTGSRADIRERACAVALAWLIRRARTPDTADSIPLPWEQRPS